MVRQAGPRFDTVGRMHEHTVRVKTATGTVEGFTRDGVNRWRAIPYAKPPVGSLRFRAPQPVQPWRGVRHCHGYGYCAPQQRMYTLLAPGRYQPTSEDCLTLNVVAPEDAEARSDESLPVMVFIHGGGYLLGSSATPIYDGASLARKGCVYVSVNYRLGALGCLELSSLSTPEITIDDNLFLRDLVMALRWVQDNIAAFGGDPNNVTIFGESAGAHAVTTLMATPEAKGLFARAISQSPASGMISDAEIAQDYAARFARQLGASKSDGARALLTARPADLVDALDRLVVEGQRDLLGAFAIGPTFGTEFLPEDPVQSMRSGTAHRVPLIIGTNADEGRLFTRFLKLLFQAFSNLGINTLIFLGCNNTALHIGTLLTYLDSHRFTLTIGTAAHFQFTGGATLEGNFLRTSLFSNFSLFGTVLMTQVVEQLHLIFVTNDRIGCGRGNTRIF